jgi:hypothetical protein
MTNTAALIERIEVLENALYSALPFVEDHEDSPIYKAGAVAEAVARIRAALGE